MQNRIVVCLRFAGGPERGFLVRARAVIEKGIIAGAVLVAFAADRIAMAFDGGATAPALAYAIDAEHTGDGEEPISAGVAQGDLELYGEATLAWGPCLADASLLAGVARPGEVVLAESVRALKDGELVTAGKRSASSATRRVRGVRLDTARPWRRQTVELVAGMRVAPLVAVDPSRANVQRGSLLLVRADPGAGGTRFLAEVAARAPKSLVLGPSGSGFEPLGALRRAIARSITRELPATLLQLAETLEVLLSGEGVRLEVAARLVSAFLAPKDGAEDGVGLIVLDDAKAIDPASLEACALAAHESGAAFGILARLDATSGLPSVLATVPKTDELELAPLAEAAAEAIAGGCTNDALDVEGRKRWARLGGKLPLGVVEAIAHGVVSGAIRWSGEHASKRSRGAGRGPVRTPAEWITARARGESAASRLLLGAVALLGGEAKMGRLGRILERAGLDVDVEVVAGELVGARWLVDTQEDWLALPTRTHKEALVALLEDGARQALHRAAASIIEEEEGVFGRVEAAWHASEAGDRPRAAKMLLEGARATAERRHEASTTQLIAFARRADPACEEAAMELLSNALARAPSLAPPPASVDESRRSSYLPRASSAPPTTEVVPTHDVVVPPAPSTSEDLAALAAEAAPIMPPVSARVPVMSLPPDSMPMATISAPPPAEAVSVPPIMMMGLPSDGPPPPDGSRIATRLGELAKEALLAADNAALERWVDGLRAAGESPVFTERMQALSRIGRGDIGDALRVLKRTRQQLDPADQKVRCQTSLAIGVALSVASRPDEALLEGLDALARARQGDDAEGARACIAFLAKLFTSVQRGDDASRLRRNSMPPPPAV